MARVNLDGKVWKDPRVKRLAKRRGITIHTTVGMLAAVWDVAYDNKTPIMPRIDVDTAADADNFAADMVAEDLATPITDDLVSVRLRGVTERIQYLLQQAERGRKGGLVRTADAARDEHGRLQANAKQTPSERLANAERSPALPLDLDLPPPPDPDLDPAQDRDLGRDRADKRRSKPRKSSIDASWSPRQEERDLARSLGVDLEDQATRFRNHFIANGETKLDWHRTFNNWLRRARDFAPRNTNTTTTGDARHGRYAIDTTIDWAAEAEATKRGGSL